MIRVAATRLGQAVRITCALGLAAAVLGLACATLLAWRLSQGPLDIGWAARRIEAAANQPGQPTRLAVGRAFLRWGGFAEGPEQGLELRLQDVVISDLQGAPAATARQVDLTVSMARLLLGQLVPRALAAEGLNLSLLRDADGRMVLDLGGLKAEESDPPAAEPGPTVTEALAELARPPRPPGRRARRPDLQHVEELTSIRVADSVLHLHDPALGSAVRVAVLSVNLQRQARGGVKGTAAATAAMGAARATVAVQADLAPDGGTDLRLAFAPVDTAAMQAAGPALPTADRLEAAVQGVATLHLDAALHPVGATASLQAGGGRLRLAGTAIGFDSLGLDAQATWDRPGWAWPERVTLSRGRVVVGAPGGGWPTTATVSGRLLRSPDGFTGTVDAAVDHLAFADIAGLWPKPLGGHVRPWLTENVTAGVARDGVLRAQFRASPTLSDVALTAVDGSLRGDDVTIWWLRPAPPVEGIQAVLTFRDPEVLDILVSAARQGPIALSNGAIRFTGMADKDQFLAVGLDLAGGVPDVMALLRNPALPLLSRSPIPVRNPAGTVSGHLAVNLPVNEVVYPDQIRIQTTTRLTDLHLGGLVAGRDLDHAAVQMTAGSDGLHAAGRGNLGGLPADLTLDMDFRDGGPTQPVQKASATARMTGADLAAAGVGTGGMLSAGSGVVTARYSRQRDGTGELAVAADLRDAGLALPGWTKAPGVAAEAHAHLQLRADRLAAVDQLGASAPGLDVQGHVNTAADQPPLLVLDRAVLGATQGRGQVRFPAAAGEPVRAVLAGSMLDLSAVLEDQNGPRSDRPGMPWVADLQFDRVRLSAKDAAGLAAVVAHVENDGLRVSALSLSSGGAEQVRAAVVTEVKAGVPGRHMTVQAADGGGLLRAAGVTGGVGGGQLTVDGIFDDARGNGALAGTAEMRNFNVRDAPVLGKLLQAATVYGVVDALRGPGLVFTDLVMPFRYGAGVLQVTEARAFSSSLGLTAKGRIDTGAGKIDLQGTVVPAYVVNSLLGRLPLVGRVFSNERGGGVFAVDYGLHGALANPAVSVNPLSALTPGFLRGLFHLFD